MAAPKGRRIARLTILLGLLVLGATAFLFKDAALERWRVYRLHYGGPEARRRALEELGELPPGRSIPILVSLFKSWEKVAPAREGGVFGGAIELAVKIGPEAVAAAFMGVQESSGLSRAAANGSVRAPWKPSASWAPWPRKPSPPSSWPWQIGNSGLPWRLGRSGRSTPAGFPGRRSCSTRS